MNNIANFDDASKYKPWTCSLTPFFKLTRRLELTGANLRASGVYSSTVR